MDTLPPSAPPWVRPSPEQVRRTRWAYAGVGLAILAPIAAILVVPELASVITGFTENSRANLQCRGRLMQIGLALHNYHDEYDAFPPLALKNEHGEELLSGLVLLLPFMEEPFLYEEFNLNEPWHSETNIALVAPSYRMFACPASDFGTSISYRLLVAEDADEDNLRLGDFVVVELQTNDPWTKPTNVAWPRVYRQLESTTYDHRDRHVGGMNVLLSDGSVHFVSATLIHEMPITTARDFIDAVTPDRYFYGADSHTTAW